MIRLVMIGVRFMVSVRINVQFRDYSSGIAISSYFEKKNNAMFHILCLNRIAPHCTQVRYGAITAWNRCENYLLHTTMFFEKLPFCLEIAVPVLCLPRVICRHARC